MGVRRAGQQHLVADQQQAGRVLQQRADPALRQLQLRGGFYLTSAPIATVAWKAESGQKWTVPVGGGVGKIFHLGKLPVNTQLSAYYNAVKPDFGADWQIRAQVQFMFPK